MNKDLTVGDPQTVLWKFCLPLFGSIIFQQLYNIADSLVAGRFIGENALAAVGNSYEVTLIFIAFAFGCNMGCSVIVSQLFGAKEYGSLFLYRKGLTPRSARQTSLPCSAFHTPTPGSDTSYQCSWMHRGSGNF
ncbi:MAG: MATE family efflux transporter [Muribaculaceae bacterium]|nr:MATE family efflux transporter [Muribaculaceae bacterium]